ncbi:hypothetical protein CK203_010038 [Vitis vinifera]|uniref:Uncharacterized protein n=1 Tax=Vitis vinifera TaxID=29760 RepID=A0A438JVD3_VITVI|nr:hypothetical protein CK203_010038 [Vitis vinifera]
MAQKRENEQATETELKVPETLTLCVQTCGFSASDKPRSRSPSPPDDPDSTLENSDQALFDYKAAGREMIAKENPVVRPAKILKV